MAEYQNQIPASLAAGDVIIITQSGTYEIYKDMRVSATLTGGKGGNAGSASAGPYHASGGSGGNGGKLVCELDVPMGSMGVQVRKNGAAGESKTVSEGTATGGSGGSGSPTSISIGGVVVAQANGGGGGKGTSATYYADSGGYTSGSPNNGASGGASVVPPGGVVTTGGGGNLPALVMTVLYINTAPPRPNNVDTTSAPGIDSDAQVFWSEAVDPDGDAVNYVLQRRFQTSASPGEWSAWLQVYEGSDTAFTDFIPNGWMGVQWRVQALDDSGATAGWRESVPYAVNQNRRPFISGQDTDMGSMDGAFEFPFTVGDEDPDDTLTVTVHLDGVELMRITNAQRGQEYAARVSTERFIGCANGVHVLEITVTDDGGAFSTRRVTWERVVRGVDVIVGPLNEDEVMPTQLAITPRVTLIPDASERYLACNNAHDVYPTWEDITEAVRNRRAYLFANTEKTALYWGVAVRITLEKGAVPGMLSYKESTGAYA